MELEKIIPKSLIAVCFLFASSFSLFAQQAISGNFNSNGQSRSYLGAVPNNPQAPLRLVILFCGVNENASQMALRGFDSVLGNNSMVVYPEPSSNQLGFDNVNGVDDFQMVEDLINTIDSIYSIDTSDICVGGFSNGGIFTYNLACDFNAGNSNRPYKFKAIAVISGAMDSLSNNNTSCSIVNNIPLIAFHGTQDPVIQYNGGQIQPPVSMYADSVETTVDFWATSNNSCNVNPTITNLPDLVVETPIPSTVQLVEYNCASSKPTRLYRIMGGRHAWPSGNANLDNFQSRNLDINASALIANFFNNQTTSIAEENNIEQNLSVYPNPFKDVLSIDANFEIDRIEIVNTLGKTVFTERRPQNSLSLDHLPSGIYFITIEDVSGRNTTKKIIK